jgi:type IV secretory pathway TraG/TraD family ATPase VirD4
MTLARDFFLVYLATLLPMLAALLQRRAPRTQFFRLPFAAILIALLGLILWNLLRQALPSSVPHANLYAASLAMFAMLGYATGILLNAKPPTTTVKRGTVIEEGRETQRESKRQLRKNPNLISLAGIAIDSLDETKHFKLIGTTGTGKSTAITELLTRALARGDRAIIADPDGGYLNRFYDAKAGDVILNLFDSRSRSWDLFSEIENVWDVEQLARALIPDGDGADASWRAYARTFFTAITRTIWEAGKIDPSRRTVAELYRALTIAETEELRLLVAGTPAQPFLESGNERMFGSIRSVTSAAVGALEHVAHQTGAPFTVRDWIRGGQGSDEKVRVLYLPYTATQISALRGLISAWMRLAIFETMQPSRAERPGCTPPALWFVVDELDALGRIDGLKDALARLRKFGGRCVLGFQSIAQVRGTYGDTEAQTIVENCGNTLILRCSASEGGGTARFASKLIGDREVIRPQTSESRRTSFLEMPHRSRTTSEQHVTEPAVLPSEIEQLPDLTGYLKIASKRAWQSVIQSI